jgi:hypothetical protein
MNDHELYRKLIVLSTIVAPDDGDTSEIVIEPLDASEALLNLVGLDLGRQSRVVFLDDSADAQLELRIHEVAASRSQRAVHARSVESLGERRWRLTLDRVEVGALTAVLWEQVRVGHADTDHVHIDVDVPGGGPSLDFTFVLAKLPPVIPSPSIRDRIRRLEREI